MFVTRADPGGSRFSPAIWPPGGRFPAPPSRDPIPSPRALAGAGTLLCMHRPDLGDALEGWRRARRVALQQRLDSDGLDECLYFFDAQGACCWRLHLLPDSDFLAWDALVENLPLLEPGPGGGLAERLWRRLAGRLRGDAWCGVAVRLRAEGVLGRNLMAQVAPLSEAGRRTMERLCRQDAP